MQHAIDAQASDFMMPDVMKIGGVNAWLRAACCQIGANSCNLGSKNFSFNKGFRLNATTQSWHLMPLPGSGKSIRIQKI